MTKQRLARLHAALLTPYDTAGEVSHACLRRLVDHVAGQGISGFYVGGSTGEGLMQSTAERLEILETVAEAARGATLIGHVGALTTAEALTLARGAGALGYDAVSAIPPIYFPHRKDAILGYYQEIAATGLPLIVYNIPAMSGVSFSLDDLCRLLELPGVVGIKQTSIDMYQTEQLRAAFPQAVILNGYDEILLSGLATGCDGGVGSTFNILGELWVALARALAEGQLMPARALQARGNRMIDALVKAGVFPGLKAVMHGLGVIDTPICRAPLATLRDAGPLLETLRTARTE